MLQALRANCAAARSADALAHRLAARRPYSFEDVLDNDGIDDEPLTIALDMTVAGDPLLLDFSRTSPPCAGPVNISRATAVAACYVALKHLFPDVPANAGCSTRSTS